VAAPSPDFSRLHSTGLLSDCSVIIKEEGRTSFDSTDKKRTAKRARHSAAQGSTEQDVGTTFKAIPVHKVILWGMSKFFQAKVRIYCPVSLPGSNANAPVTLSTSCRSCHSNSKTAFLHLHNLDLHSWGNPTSYSTYFLTCYGPAPDKFNLSCNICAMLPLLHS
jgi:hypothetical protein